MRRTLTKYEDVVSGFLTVADVVLAGALVDRIVKGKFVPLGIVLLILLLGVLVTHVVLFRINRVMSRDERVEILKKVLEIAARALVFPESWDVVTVRAYCHRFDHKGRLLHYVASRSSDSYDDVFTDIPMDEMDEDGRRLFVIAEAVANGNTTFRKLPAKRTPAEVQAHIWDGVRFVLACPIYERGQVKSEKTCLGVVSFDTSRDGGEKISLDGKRARDIIAELAKTVSLLQS